MKNNQKEANNKLPKETLSPIRYPNKEKKNIYSEAIKTITQLPSRTNHKWSKRRDQPRKY